MKNPASAVAAKNSSDCARPASIKPRASDTSATFPSLTAEPRGGPLLDSHFGILIRGPAIGIALTAFKSPQQAVVTFGVWAFAAGVAQLSVGISRRKQLGGQWAMILSGLQSAAAGVAFILGGLHDKTHIKDLGGYAIFGGVYFLIAGILMHRKLSRNASVGAAAAIERG